MAQNVITHWNQSNFLKGSIFLDIMQCSPLKINRCFGGTCRLCLQGQRISQTRKQRESRWQAEPSFTLVFIFIFIYLHSYLSLVQNPLDIELVNQTCYMLIAWLILLSSRWRRHVPRKPQLTLNGLKRYIPGDGTVHNHRCEDIKSFIIHFFCMLWKKKTLTVFWDMMLCSLWHRYQRFGGTYCLKIQHAKWRQQVPSSRQYISIRLNSITSKKTATFIFRAVRTWSLT
jgi:hypothetical protein